jgi:hypothetical protein
MARYDHRHYSGSPARDGAPARCCKATNSNRAIASARASSRAVGRGEEGAPDASDCPGSERRRAVAHGFCESASRGSELGAAWCGSGKTTAVSDASREIDRA